MSYNKQPSHSTQPATILIADDDPHVCKSLKEILSYRGYHCIDAGDGKETLDRLNENKVDLLLLDLKMPRINGMEVLKQSLATDPDLPVVMISGQGTIQSAVEATRLGAYDFLEKPLETERTLLTIRNALEKSHLKIQRDQLLNETRKRYRMIGTDPKMQEVYALIERASKVDSKVLISGEHGTGKELVARAIHLNSDRVASPFAPINCSAIPETLIESELFGHEKGAFTGAHSDRPGKLQQAQGCTLFLDEIGDMSLMMQAKILRVIEDGLVKPVGSSKAIKIDVRIIAATNKNLATEIEEGNFRSDLFYRLNVIPVNLPSLRERTQDIRYLAEHFLEEVCETEGLPQKTFSKNIWPILTSYNWPGNVRELRNVVERAAVLTAESLIESPIVREALQTKQP
ncbi:MAG: sigma-54-dependent transcriptional regulator, partial [bacterium]